MFLLAYAEAVLSKVPSGTLEAVLYLVEIFNLIEFLGVASLFGWFTFARLNYEEMDKIGAKKRETARRNLVAVSNYFLISFLFYSLAGIGDYLYHHGNHPYAQFFPADVLFRFTLEFFVIGTLVLVAPFVLVGSITRFGRDLGDIHPAPFDYTLSLFMVTAVTSLVAWTTPIFVATVMPIWLIETSYFVSGFIPFVGLYIGLRYFWKDGLKPSMNRKLVLGSLFLLTAAPIWVIVVITIINLVGRIG